MGGCGGFPAGIWSISRRHLGFSEGFLGDLGEDLGTSGGFGAFLGGILGFLRDLGEFQEGFWSFLMDFGRFQRNLGGIWGIFQAKFWWVFFPKFRVFPPNSGIPPPDLCFIMGLL